MNDSHPAIWTKADTSQWHVPKDQPYGRKEFRCGLAFTTLTEPLTDTPHITSFGGLCPLCKGKR